MSHTLCAPPMAFALSTNSSTAALPLLPRRPHSAPSSRRVSPTTTPPATLSPSASLTRLVVHPPTPPTPTASGSRTPSPDPARPKRIRGQRIPGLRAPQHSTPVPHAHARRDSDSDSDTPRPRPRPASRLRIDTAAPPTRHMSESHVHTLRTVSAAAPAPAPGPLLRKKSGEPLRSSLKGRRLVVDTAPPAAALASKSEPATPTLAKAVHFDAQLEHVKLFLAEQKPLAVSRDGSPTATDTSGTESEFPAFVYGRDADADPATGADKGRLVLRTDDLPPFAGLGARDVALEALTLDAGGADVVLHGVVRVRNVAFEKWVAVRFTTDAWQTTSEVTARHAGGADGGAGDRFAFALRVSAARIEARALVLAVRFVCAGREMWDNNAGRNYVLRFAREPAPAPAERAEEDGISEDLRTRLEAVAKGRAAEGVPTRAALGERYSFGHAWRARTSTYPAEQPPRGANSIPWPHKRARAANPFAPPPPPPATALPTAPTALSTSSTAPAPEPARPDTSESDGSGSGSSDAMITLVPALRRRQHVRGGALEGAPLRIMTAPSPPASPLREEEEGQVAGAGTTPLSAGTTTPLSAGTTPPAHYGPRAPTPNPLGFGYASPPPALPRFHSFPPSDGSPAMAGAGAGAGMLSAHWRGASEDSTPTIASPSSSASSASPSPSPDARDSPLHHLSDYHVLLSRFCFFTGDDAGAGAVPRSHSASSIEALLGGSPRARDGWSPALGGVSPSASFAWEKDGAPRSGSATPTRMRFEDVMSTPRIGA